MNQEEFAVRIEKSRSAVVILQGVEQNIEIPVK